MASTYFPFSRLPPELRQQIWEMVLLETLEARLVIVIPDATKGSDSGLEGTGLARRVHPTPRLSRSVVLCINTESRAFALSRFFNIKLRVSRRLDLAAVSKKVEDRLKATHGMVRDDNKTRNWDQALFDRHVRRNMASEPEEAAGLMYLSAAHDTFCVAMAPQRFPRRERVPADYDNDELPDWARRSVTQGYLPSERYTTSSIEARDRARVARCLGCKVSTDSLALPWMLCGCWFPESRVQLQACVKDAYEYGKFLSDLRVASLSTVLAKWQ